VSRSIRIVIGALGGEGGGVLGQWIADMAERQGYLSQTTSVPGVAQRTGATIYYIELFPRSELEQRGRLPVLSMFPTPGDVDIVICSEIVEAGRLIQRGFVTPQRTTLISSTHRTYGITEKQAMGSGIIDKDSIVAVAREQARRFIGFDMLATSSRHNAVINAALFGALAETGELPFARETFEETIRRGGIAVENNLKAFAASFELAAAQQQPAVVQVVDPGASLMPASFELPPGTTEHGRDLLARVAGFPVDCQEMIFLGVKKLVQYQDYQYAHQYLDRLQQIRELEPQGRHELTQEVARFLALWMAFEDLPRVAQIKISRQRFQRFRDEVQAAEEQQIAMVEFLHPRVEEFCGVMPAGLGRKLLSSKAGAGFLGFFARPRNIRTNSVFGYLCLYLLARLRHTRRSSLIYQIEQQHIGEWLAAIEARVATDYELALEIARCGRLIKGYGDTRERGLANMDSILALMGQLARAPAAAVAALREAALADDDGVEFSRVRAELLSHPCG
jgi:indolepyruvate ferredoxin oxidoreductase beta subunit